MNDKQALLRSLPSVDSLLAQSPIQDLIAEYNRSLVLEAIRLNLADAREAILQSQQVDLGQSAFITGISQHLRRQRQSSLRPVINATGVIIHTNLGRALLSKSAREAMSAIAGAYNTLEFDLQSGKRGSRLVHAGQILRELTGAEAALVVNNNASALIMILRALAQDREVIISRGQLLEIGGGFRIPAIMEESGARLVEVGTTNRTRIDDYAAAITERTALLLRVHSSNFKQIGFVQQPSLAELTTLAHQHGLLMVDDLGSGTLIDTQQFGLDHEPTVQDSVQAGVDLLCFSGDKLLGGPQAGIIIGKTAAIAQLKSHPLARALRSDKLTYAALITTLQHYQRGEALQQIPVWQMISRSLNDITSVAKHWSATLGGRIISGQSTIGGGSLPGASLPTTLLALDSQAPHQLQATLRHSDPPVIARIAAGCLLLDPRTVLPEQEADLLAALQAVI